MSLLIIGAFLVAPPYSLPGKARLVGYAVCHQIPERTFHIHGEALPLCARCSGTFLGALTGFIVLNALGRQRAAGLPPARILVVLILFIVSMAVDGVNSYMTFFPTMPHLYEPHNLLRITTGTLNGLALSSIVYPVLNYTLWADARDEPSLRNFKELGLLVVSGAVLSGLVVLGPDFLLYPLTLLSAAGVLLMLSSLNTMIALAIVGREGRARHWQQVVLPLCVGLALAFVEIGAIDVLRTMVTQAAGLPF